MAIFGMELDMTSGTLQCFRVLHGSGLLETTPYLSLKGGQCDKILEVFGEETQLAITGRKTYKDGRKRKDRIMCISAVWVKGEGKVTLEMDVYAGIKLAEKLHQAND